MLEGVQVANGALEVQMVYFEPLQGLSDCWRFPLLA